MDLPINRFDYLFRPFAIKEGEDQLDHAVLGQPDLLVPIVGYLDNTSLSALVLTCRKVRQIVLGAPELAERLIAARFEKAYPPIENTPRTPILDYLVYQRPSEMRPNDYWRTVVIASGRGWLLLNELTSHQTHPHMLAFIDLRTRTVSVPKHEVETTIPIEHLGDLLVIKLDARTGGLHRVSALCHKLGQIFQWTVQNRHDQPSVVLGDALQEAVPLRMWRLDGSPAWERRDAGFAWAYPRGGPVVRGFLPESGSVHTYIALDA